METKMSYRNLCAGLLAILLSARAAYADDLCAKVFNDSWQEYQGTSLTSAMQQLTTIVKVPYIAFFCSGLAVDELAISEIAFPVEYPTIIFIGLNNDLEKQHPEIILGILAHELAHYFAPAGRECGSYRSENEIVEFTSCEAAVDTYAASWVGEPVMLQTLKTSYAFRLTQPGHSATEALVQSLAARIAALE